MQRDFYRNKYLNTPELDNDVCIFSFVGRITEQKGVDMICSVVEEFINMTHGKAAFIIGGPATNGDPHGDHVINACDYLINKFPKNFWANPRGFFNDVPVLSLGSDFCLMPSRFEPGGIVQHEFFIAGTPAVVFATGGLKDSVTEYDYRTGKGNGFDFLNYDRYDLLMALERAYGAYKNKEVYRRLRKNALESAIDVANVSKEWCSEVYRVRGKIFVDKRRLLEEEHEEEQKEVEELASTPELVGKEDKAALAKETSDFAEVDFKYQGKATDMVYVVGSFNGWNERDHRMGYNHLTKEFHCHIKLHPGTHHYKLKVNGKWAFDKNKKVETDENGEKVNVLVLK